MKKTALALSLAVLLAAGAGAIGWQQYRNFAAEPLDLPESGAVLLVDTGMSGRSVVERLGALGATRPGWKWRLLLRLNPTVMQAGEYRLEPGLNPLGLLDKLARGDVIRYRFTIVEGWTVRQLLAALAADPRLGVSFAEPERPTDPARLVAGYENPEGWFLPETYSYVRGDDARDVLQQAYEAMRAALDEAWAARTEPHPAQSPYELLILASIIEKETAVAAERGTVSGVFVRRLDRGMRLQTDPTVIYGLGERFDGDIRRRDLESDTPYNTYTRHGLPPTPIALPGRASLLAAARPEPGDALYFVADGSGGHTFSATLEEHEEAVRAYLEANP